jgi:hypothetical protein
MSPSGETEVLETPKRTPRKRAPKAVDVAETSTPIKRARARRVVQDDGEEAPARRSRKKVEPPKAEISDRKAPTTIKDEKQKTKSFRKHAIVIGVLLAIGIGSSAVVGFTDKGQIDVVTMIEDRNKKAEERGEKMIPTSAKDLLPNGGLIPADPGTITPNTPPATATTTASTTPEGNVPRAVAEVAEDIGTIASST